MAENHFDNASDNGNREFCSQSHERRVGKHDISGKQAVTKRPEIYDFKAFIIMKGNILFSTLSINDR